MRYVFALAFVVALAGCGGSGGLTPAPQTSSPPGGILTAQPKLFVSACWTATGCSAGGGAVFVYAPPYTGAPIATITANIDGPRQIAVDSLNNLYVANYLGDTVTEYAPPYTSTSGSLNLSPIGSASGVQVTPSGVVVSSQAATLEYAQISQSSVTPTWSEQAGNGSPPAAVDPNGNIYTFTLQGPAVVLAVWSPPSTNVVRSYSFQASLNPASIEADTHGTIYIASPRSVVIVPTSGQPVSFTPSSSVPLYATYDPHGNAIVATTSNVLVVSPQGLILQTIAQGINLASPALGFGKLVACDASSDIFVANNNATTVTIYQRPYTSAPTTIQLPSGYQPNNVVLGP